MTEATTDHARHVSEGRDVAIEQLEHLRESIDRTLVDYGHRIRTDVIEPLALSLRRSAEEQERIVEALHGERRDGHMPDHQRSFRLNVVEPLERGLAETRAGEKLAEARIHLLETLGSLALNVAEEVVRPEPSGRYQVRSSDGWIRRLRKKQIRSARSWAAASRRGANRLRRLTRQPPRGPQPYLQHVPLRLLASYHLEQRLPSELREKHEEVRRELGRALAKIARILTKHAHALLGDVEITTSLAAGSHDLEGHTGDLQDDDPQAPSHFPQDHLRGAAEHLEKIDITATAREKALHLFVQLERDILEIDSFMLDPSHRQVMQGSASFDRREELWNAWYGRMLARIGLIRRLLIFKEESIQLEERFASRIMQHCVRPARDVIQKTENRLDERSQRAEKDFTSVATPSVVRGHLEDALQAVEDGALEVLKGGRLIEETREALSTFFGELDAMLEALPEVLEINVLDERRDVDPDRPPKVVELREHAGRAYNALLRDNLRFETERLAQALSAAREEVARVPHILRFNLGSALDDLEVGARTDDQSAAQELVVDGLARSADVLGGADRLLGEGHEHFLVRTRDLLHGSFRTFHERVRIEEKVREQILDLRSEAAANIRQLAKRASARGRRVAVHGRSAYVKLLHRFRRWVRLGQEAAGLSAGTEEERFATLEELARIERLHEGLPLVYRRLFTFEPIRDATLLVGREPDLRAIERHLKHWNTGVTSPLALTGFHGSGHTSLLNVARQTLFAGKTVFVLELQRRLRSEKYLVTLVAQTLGFTGTSVSTFDELTHAILTSEKTDVPQVCIVEHLEQLYLRQIGGMELVQSFLTFTSRTAPRLMWIVTLSNYGLQVVCSAEPAASRLLVVHTLSPITRGELEAAVMKRHQRSGLSLHFETPSLDGNPLLARRLRKAATDDERQSILRTDYFDRLERASGNNFALALFYWLQSLEMDKDSDLLNVQPVKLLNFDFLQSLSLDHLFTLKALLEHATLSLPEHSELFLIPGARSEEIFEALSSLRLVERVERRSRHERFVATASTHDYRFRIQPLLLHPVIQFLRGKNVVH